MTITICGSMSFAKEMEKVQETLESMGHVCLMPEGVAEYSRGHIKSIGGGEGAKRKVEHDLIRRHYNLIKDADAILVVNHEKHGIKDYIGGNSFLEIGFAYILGKRIYLLNELPEQQLIKEELEAMQPFILNENFSLIK